MKKACMYATGLLMMSVAGVQAAVVQHLDATVSGSVPSSPVTQWIDQSGSGNDAVNNRGEVLYPGASLSASGLAGLDFGSTRNDLQLLDMTDTAALLDFSGAAAGHDGFSVLAAFKVDEMPGLDQYVVGTKNTLGYFSIRIAADGTVACKMDTGFVASGSLKVEAGDTVVVGVTYEAATGTYQLWESKNGILDSGTQSIAGNYCNGNPLILGEAKTTKKSDLYLRGMVGEVVLYNHALDASVLTDEADALKEKWISGIPSALPNIVMVFVDDWAWNGSSVAMDELMENSEMPSMIEMPNLDAMASNGMVFRNAYGSPQCSPARAALQTGQSNPRNGFTVFMTGDDYYDIKATGEGKPYYHYPVVANGADQTLRTNAVSIAEALAPMGYESALFGKWHLRDDPNNEGYYAPDGDTSNNEGNTIEGLSLDGITDPKLLTHVTTNGLNFIEEKVAEGSPFYVQFSQYAMHEGRECFPESRARYQNLPAVVAYNGGETDPANISRKSDPAVWLGMAYELDRKIGEIRQKLVDLDIADNTYVIVVSDNGYREEFFDEIFGLTQPLHAHKWWAWEAGIRVPMVVEGPGIATNSTCSANVVNYDFLPTFVDWAGGDPSDLTDIDGLSLAGLLEGEAPGTDFLNRSLYFHFPHYRTTMPHSAIIKGSDKVVYFYETEITHPEWEPVMLFDLENDIGEFHNIYTNNPALGDALYSDLMTYLMGVNARIPQVPNPNYDATFYATNASWTAGWGPFIGSRDPDFDEIDTRGLYQGENFIGFYGVSTVRADDDGGGDCVSAIGKNDWMDYAVDIESAGTYTIEFRVAADGIPGDYEGTLSMLSDGQIDTIDMTSTGGNQVWETQTATITFNQAGPQTLRLQAQSGGYRINWFWIK